MSKHYLLSAICLLSSLVLSSCFDGSSVVQTVTTKTRMTAMRELPPAPPRTVRQSVAETTGETTSKTTEQSLAGTTAVETPPRVTEAHVQNLQDIHFQALDLAGNEEDPRMKSLGEKIQDYLLAHGVEQADLSIVVQDLHRRGRYTYRPDRRYQAASCMKVGMAMTCAKLVQGNVLRWEMPIEAIPDGEQYIYDENELAAFSPAATLESLVHASLRYSSNTSTSILFSYFRRQGRWLHGLMDEAMGMHYSPDTSMSAAEGANLMIELIENPQQIEGYPMILEDLKQSTWNHFLTRDLHQECCANKYGQMAGYNHEIGVIWGSSPVIYAVYSQGVDAYEIFPGLGRLLYEWQGSDGE